MKKILEVARWEYIEKIRTKAFIISLIITPIIIILFSIIPALLAQEQYDSTKIIGILDEKGLNYSELIQDLSAYTTDKNQPAYLLINLYENGLSFAKNKSNADKQLISGRIYGYIVVKELSKDLLNLEFRSKNNLDTKDLERFELAFNKLKLKEQLKSYNIDPDIVNFSKNSISIKQTLVDGTTKSGQDLVSIFYKSIIYIILLTLMIIYSGQMLVRSLLEEKSNRLIEILISSCKPEDLLAGKILGLSALGLTQMIFWLFVGTLLLGFNLIPVTSFDNIFEIIVYFILGYIFYSSLLVGIGSIVSTEQEAQQITSYLSMILIIPIIIILPAIQNPESLFIKILTYFPLTLPSVMILKINISNITISELIITILIMLVSIFLTIKLATRIFRVGIFYYNKMPAIRELKSWIWQK
jgi:ABC-2 type transport system permease protein